MHGVMRVASAVLTLVTVLSAQGRAQATHEVRLVVDTEKDESSFLPATVTAKPGDVLVFKVINGAPHSVVFESKGLTPAARSALNGAMPGRAGELSSPLLTENGAEYRVTVPDLPKGTYSFFCLPHRAYDMRGELSIK